MKPLKSRTAGSGHDNRVDLMFFDGHTVRPFDLEHDFIRALLKRDEGLHLERD